LAGQTVDQIGGHGVPAVLRTVALLKVKNKGVAPSLPGAGIADGVGIIQTPVFIPAPGLQPKRLAAAFGLLSRPVHGLRRTDLFSVPGAHQTIFLRLRLYGSQQQQTDQLPHALKLTTNSGKQKSPPSAASKFFCFLLFAFCFLL
jgi:hypothetical protein